MPRCLIGGAVVVLTVWRELHELLDPYHVWNVVRTYALLFYQVPSHPGYLCPYSSSMHHKKARLHKGNDLREAVCSQPGGFYNLEKLLMYAIKVRTTCP